MNYYLHLIFIIEIYSILVISVNLQLGFSRLLNLSMGIFYGLGAYTYAILSTNFGLPFLIIIPCAIMVSILFSLFISFASTRFNEEIFAFVSLAFQMIMYTVLWNWDSITGGATGISAIPLPKILGYELSSPVEFIFLGGLLVLFASIISIFIHRSSFGRILKAIREDEIAAQTLGKRANYFKFYNIAISCSLASIAGVLFSSYTGYIDPTSFGLNESLDIIFILMIGGLLSTYGAIVGTSLYFILHEIIRSIGFQDQISFNLRIILFAITVIIILYHKPMGLLGKYDFQK